MLLETKTIQLAFGVAPIGFQSFEHGRDRRVSDGRNVNLGGLPRHKLSFSPKIAGVCIWVRDMATAHIYPPGERCLAVQKINLTANCNCLDDGSPPEAEIVPVILPAFGFIEFAPV